LGITKSVYQLLCDAGKFGKDVDGNLFDEHLDLIDFNRDYLTTGRDGFDIDRD